MWSKKIITAAAAAMMAAALITFPAAAHGHHRQAQVVTEDTSCPVCTVDGCEESGRHTHDGHYYCGYEHASGYCDGSCQNTAGTGCHSRGHHGCHR